LIIDIIKTKRAVFTLKSFCQKDLLMIFLGLFLIKKEEANFFFLEAGSHYTAQAGLELTLYSLGTHSGT
jgi:hypothetical protein